ncbi:MAG: hypothetical protein QM709_04735 [Spongiibacteraceae bacterium]
MVTSLIGTDLQKQGRAMPITRLLRTTVLCAIALTACAESSSLPTWLQQRIAAYETGPEHDAPLEIWQIRHDGKAAYFFVANCCDQYNPLYDEKGQLICHPSGGIVGRGDGRCPVPMDEGSKATFIWSHPKSPLQEHSPPSFMQNNRATNE